METKKQAQKRQLTSTTTIPPKRRRLNDNSIESVNNNSNKIDENKKEKDWITDLKLEDNEISDLIELFEYYLKNGIRNQTLDYILFISFKELSLKLSMIGEAKEMSSQFELSLKNIIKPKTYHESIYHFNQFLQFKGQLNTYKYLSRDLSVPSIELDYGLGMYNPLSNTNKLNKLELSYKNNILNKEENKKRRLEELAYLDEYNSYKKLIHRKQILNDFIKNNNNNNNLKNTKDEIKKAKNELKYLKLISNQKKLRNELIKNDRMLNIYQNDDSNMNEALLNPDIFIRTNKIGLHFNPNITIQNHPPTMATSNEIFPFHYPGNQ